MYVGGNRRGVSTMVLAAVVIAIVAVSGGAYAYYYYSSSNSTKVVTFGVVLPLSGALSQIGQATLSGYQIWVNYTNANGGINIPGVGNHLQIKLIVEDDASQPSNAASMTKLLIIQDKVNGVLGGILTPDTDAMAPIMTQYQYPLIAEDATVSTFTSGQYPYLFSTLNNPVHNPSGPFLSGLVKNYSLNNIAVLQSNEQDPISVTATVLSQIKQASPSAHVTWFNYTQGTSDFGPLLLGVKQLHPNLIYVSDEYAPEEIDLFRAMATDNVTANVVASFDAFDGLQFNQALGNGIVGMLGMGTFASPAAPPSLYPTMWKNMVVQHLGASYLWNQFVFQAFMQISVMTQAYEQTGQFTGPSVRSAIATSSYSTPGGPWHPDSTGMNAALVPFVVQYQLINGTVIPQIISGPYKTGSFIYPFPGWQ